MEKNLITLKEINKKNILKIIIRNEKISRTDIAKFFKISRPTISSYINEMINEGLVEEAGKSSSTPSGGKRATLLKFNSNAGYIISISIGTNLLRFAITDLGTNIIDSMAIPTEEWLGPEIIIKKILDSINEIISKTKIDRKKIFGIGIKGPGIIDSEKGMIVFFPNLTGWKNINLKEIIENKTGIPVYIDNVCRILAIAEKKFGIAQNIRDFVVVFTGTGIGTGVFIDNKLFSGNKGIAGEVGHIITDFDSNKLCHCGNYGCLETLCSSRALIDNIKEDLRKGEKSSLKENREFDFNYLADLFKKNDPLVVKHVTENARLLGIGISNIIKMFSPEIVVIHGKFLAFGEKYLTVLKEAVYKSTFSKVENDYNIQFTKLPEEAGLIGTSVFAFEKIFKLDNLNISDEYMVRKDF